jgi:hypothetical protein
MVIQCRERALSEALLNSTARALVSIPESARTHDHRFDRRPFLFFRKQVVAIPSTALSTSTLTGVHNVPSNRPCFFYVNRDPQRCGVKSSLGFGVMIPTNPARPDPSMNATRRSTG